MVAVVVADQYRIKICRLHLQKPQSALQLTAGKAAIDENSALRGSKKGGVAAAARTEVSDGESHGDLSPGAYTP